jgi:hypothetical protein
MPRTKRHDAHDPRNGTGEHDRPHGPDGEAAPHPDEAAETAASDRMRRAEEAVDRIATAVGMYTSVVGRKLLQWTARAREGFEDMWAEAQQIRARNRAAPSADGPAAEPEKAAEREHPHRRGHRH